jgi:hypothetical protein
LRSIVKLSGPDYSYIVQGVLALLKVLGLLPLSWGLILLPMWFGFVLHSILLVVHLRRRQQRRNSPIEGVVQMLMSDGMKEGVHFPRIGVR